MVKIFIKFVDFAKNFLDKLIKLFKLDLLSLTMFAFIFVTPSFLITTYLYNLPFGQVRIDLNNPVGKEYFINPNGAATRLTRTFFAKIFQSSLNLDWYDLCIVNKNRVFLNGQQPDYKELKKGDLEAGSMQLIFISGESNATSSLYASLNSINCQTLNLGDKWSIERPLVQIREVWLRLPEKVIAPIGVTVNEGSITLKSTNVDLDSSQSFAYIKNNFSAWILKFFAIFGLWSAFILFIKKLIEFVKN